MDDEHDEDLQNWENEGGFAHDPKKVEHHKIYRELRQIEKLLQEIEARVKVLENLLAFAL